MPVRLRASLSNSAHASRFVNSRTTGTRPFPERRRTAFRTGFFGAGLFVFAFFATRVGFFTARVDAFMAAVARFALLAGGFLATLDRLATVARLGPRATAFTAGFLRAAAFLAGLRAGFRARGFDFMAYLF